MQLGSFYGFTAPMLLLSYDAELLSITQGFNAALNRVAAMDTKQELVCFERVLSQIPVLYQPKSAGTLEKYSTSAMVQNGELVGSYSNEVNAEEIRADIIAALGDQCAVRLLEKLQESEEYNNAFLDRTYFLRNLEELVLSLMKDKTFTLDNINKLTREFIKLFKTDGEHHDNSELQNDIMSYCEVSITIPEELSIDGQHFQLSEDERKLILYFKKHHKELKELETGLHITGWNDDAVFNVSFMDFIARKPTSLYYLVINQFDHLKNSDIRLFPSVYAYVCSEYGKLKSLIQKRLLTEDNTLEMVDVSEIETDNTELDVYLTEVCAELQIDQMAKSDFEKLEKLYYHAANLTIDSINEICSTKFTKASFEKTMQTFDDIGLGGLNLVTLSLMQESLKNIIFTDSNKIFKSPNYLEELQKVSNDVEALLGTLQPIGGDLSV